MKSYIATFLSSIVSVYAFDKVPYSGSLPIPTPQQLRYQGSISGLIHFGMSTFAHDGDPGCTELNWNGCDPAGGCNTSQVSTFNPVNFSVTNWIASFNALGATSAVLTAKHGCGFLGWQTKTTLPDGSPYRYHVPDEYLVVDEFVKEMTNAGLGYGFYYSLSNNFYLNEFGHNVRPSNTLLPGQANVTQQQYEDIAVAQVHELWTQFGPLIELWLDNGVGDLGDRIAAMINSTYARNAVAFNGGGVSENPVRWCGTEGGQPSGWPTVWSTSCCGWCPDGSGSGCPPNSTGAMYQPSGVDVTLQQGDHWFYTPGDALHPLSDLITFYHRSVGANAHLEIDFAIDRTGRVDPVHAVGYASFGNWIRSCYGKPLVTSSLPSGATTFIIQVSGTEPIDRVSMQEDQTIGQMIISYTVEAQVNGAWQPFSSGVTIGSNRIDVISTSITPTAFRFTVTAGFEVPTGLVFNAFAASTCDPSPFEYPTM
jgi:alpha-L-fucosidase